MTKPSINWDHVAPEFVVMAADSDGAPWLYEDEPKAGNFEWFGCRGVEANVFASFVPGTCDWRDSLVIRPGYEETPE